MMSLGHLCVAQPARFADYYPTGNLLSDSYDIATAIARLRDVLYESIWPDYC